MSPADQRGLTLLPAVDIAGGRAVGMEQANADSATVHGEPLDAALKWQRGGAEWIHLVDLDAAFGRGSNAQLLGEVVRALDVDIEVSGGIRDDAALERALATGCTRIVLGAEALEARDWCERVIGEHGERIAVAIDVNVPRGQDASLHATLAPRGWPRGGGDLWETLIWLEEVGCVRYIVTDVNRDGAMSGPNLDLCAAVSDAVVAPVIVSGGISSLADLTAFVEMSNGRANLEGAIVGKALYAGRFTLPDALRAVRRVPKS